MNKIFFIFFILTTVFFIYLYNNFDILFINSNVIVKSSHGNTKVYNLPQNSNKFLIIWEKRLYIIISDSEKTSYRISNFGTTIGKYIIWPKNSYKGIILGDGVKGDSRDKYIFFNKNKIYIKCHYSKNDKVELFIERQ